jgi:hypothetical protein
MVIDDAAAGRKITCPSCQSSISVPASYITPIDKAIDAAVSAICAGKSDQASARLRIQVACSQCGYNPESVGVKPRSRSDLMNGERLDFVVAVNVSLRQGYRQWSQGMDEVSLDQWPAAELAKAVDEDEPVDWPSRWRSAGGVLYDGRMIAHKLDRIWLAVSDFNVPYPAFAVGSWMTQTDVDVDETDALRVPPCAQPVWDTSAYAPPLVSVADHRVDERLGLRAARP